MFPWQIAGNWRDCYRSYRSMTKSNIVQQKGMSQACIAIMYRHVGKQFSRARARARNRHVITRRLELTNAVLARPRAHVCNLAIAACSGGNLFRPINRTTKLLDCAILGRPQCKRGRRWRCQTCRKSETPDSWIRDLIRACYCTAEKFPLSLPFSHPITESYWLIDK